MLSKIPNSHADVMSNGCETSLSQFRDPLTMLVCRNPHGANYVCTTCDLLLQASSNRTFVALLCRDINRDIQGQHQCYYKAINKI